MLLQGRMKLRIQLIPKPLFGHSLRDALGKTRWDRLRRGLIKENGACCTICGSTERLHGHEVWAYREKNAISTALLREVQIVCVDCHDICHWARTTDLFQKGKIDSTRHAALRRHFRKVNNCKQTDFDEYFVRSLRTWSRRSKKHWTIDWGDYEPAVRKAANARAAWETTSSSLQIDDDYHAAGPGHHMPPKCPSCGSGLLQLIEEDPSEMSEAQEADYTQGVSGSAFCQACGFEFDW